MSLVLLWGVSVAIHIAYVRWDGLDPVEHMEQLIGYYVDQADRSPLPEQIALKLHWAVFEATPAQRLLSAEPPAARAHDSRVSAGLRRSIWSTFRPDLVVAGYATILFGVKAALIAMAAVVFMLLLLTGAADGLAQRYIRTQCFGHESAALYHRAKLYGLRLLPAFAASVFFCSPIAFNPAWLFVPAAFASALLLRLQATYYKKYL